MGSGRCRRAALGGVAYFAGLCLASWASLAGAAGAPGAAAFSSHCAACHSAEPGVNKIGPSLAGVFGRASGTVPRYNYSPAMKAAGLHWDAGTLDKFLQNPSGAVHGTKMFVGVPDAATRQRVIAYLKTLEPQAAGN